METSQKFFLSICLLVLVCSCKDNSNPKEQSLACFHYGMSHYQGTQESINAFAKAVECDPTHAESWRELSIPFLKRGMPHLWKKYMDKAIELDPITWQGYRGYNYLWFYRDYKSAIADFDATDTLTPNFTDAPQGHSVDYWRGIAYLGLKDYKNSIAYFDKHIQKETEETGEDWVEHEAFLYRGIAHYEAGNLEKALENINTLLKYNADFADAKYYKALIAKDELQLLQQDIQMKEFQYSDHIHTKILKETFQKKKQEALTIINQGIENFNTGYSDQRPYVETIRQLYLEDYKILKAKLESMH